MNITPVIALPVLRASSGVVFPEMVVTFRLETTEARAALDSASHADDRLLLVPQVDGRSALVGTVVRIEHVQETPDGSPAVVIRGIRRAKAGAAVQGEGEGLWVEVELADQDAEAGYIRTWLEHVFEIPWGARTEDNLDLTAALEMLDADHTGLSDVKDRILEFLAVRKLHADRVDENPKGSASSGIKSGGILVLVGPPGVGKTSLGESVARPGRVLRALADAGTMNPVILLDEVDKIATHRGDPSSALLEVLDPAQNDTFRDNYLEMDLDLSDVFFIATANVAEQISGPLLDRMEVINLRGYSAEEKAEIARGHLLPRVKERNGLTDEDVVLGDEVIASVINDYTREAGVRRLEQRLGRLVRRAARRVAENEATPVLVEIDQLVDALGRPAPTERPAQRVTAPGIVAGLAVTGAGGDVLFVEAVATQGKPGLSLTGQLGDVMRESGEIAMAYLRSHADRLSLDIGDKEHFHVHFPAGSTPKDGPSAGVTMTTALASVLSGRQVRSDVAMTGEVTLHGRVLPIGGVKEKVLAAQRAGVTTVILPADNRYDAEELPDEITSTMEFHFVEDVADVLEIALAA